MEPSKEGKTTKKDWAEMDADDVVDQGDEEIGTNEETAAATKKFSKAGKQGAGNAPKGKKNAQGDFIVTTFDVDQTHGLKKTVKDDGEEDSDSNDGGIDLGSDSDYGNEQPEEEEKKGEPAIIEEPKKKEGK